MIEIEFDFNQIPIIIQAKLDEPFQAAVDKFVQKTSINPNSVYFLANGKQLNPKLKLEKQMTNINKNNKKMKVLVNLIVEDKADEEKVIIKSKDIICPKCFEPCRIKIDDGRIKLFDCAKNHEIGNIKLSEFQETQKINISKIVCDKCKFKNKGNCSNNEFYKCLTCNNNLCVLCKQNHTSNHYIINYDQKNYICLKHNEAFIKYCFDCKQNLCFACEEHEKHKSISLNELKPNIDKAKERLSTINNNIKQFISEVEKTLNKLNKLIEDLKIYEKINNDILGTYEIKKRNYQILKNINDFIDNDDIIIKKITTINTSNDNNNDSDKISKIIDLYKILELVDKSKFKKEELEESDIIDNLKSLKVLEFKQNKYEKINVQIKKDTTSLFMPSTTVFELEEPINGLIGLANIGAVCYMNATLQCFSNIELLRTYFLTPEIFNSLDNNKETKNILSFALAEVFKNLWIKYDESKKYYAPENFKKIISYKNPLFKGIQANDPKDLILFMLETMHSKLKTKDTNVIYDSNCVPNKHKLEEVYLDFSNNYLSKNKSKIFDIFYGCTNIVRSCINCHCELHNVQVCNILIFPLEEVRKYKKYNTETPVTINDFFEYNQRCNVYESYYCNGCNKNNSTAISFTRFLYTPRVLIINLNRGKGIQFNVKINFDEFIDIKIFVAVKESPYKYELIGVISHFGESGYGGHFIAFCKHFTKMGCKWYKFNDAFVEECTFDDIKTKGMPYVLFYNYIDVA